MAVTAVEGSPWVRGQVTALSRRRAPAPMWGRGRPLRKRMQPHGGGRTLDQCNGCQLSVRGSRANLRKALGQEGELVAVTADWSRLTTYLRNMPDDVLVSWADLDRIVGGLPRSAVDHYPQWWHGDRSHVRSWTSAGYQAAQIHPETSVRFSRVRPTGRGRGRSVERLQPRTAVPARAPGLSALDPQQCHAVVPCSSSKKEGGSASPFPVQVRADLQAARRAVLSQVGVDDSGGLLAAWQRYDGYFHREAHQALRTTANEGRLTILSGGYGVLDGREPIGRYDRVLRMRDWPVGLLQGILAERAEACGGDVVCFAGASTPYAKLLRSTSWRLPSGRGCYLVTVEGLRGVRPVSTALGQSFASFIAGRKDYPTATAVDRIA